MIAFYCYFPPVRAGPIRQLELNSSLVISRGKWHLDLRKYKTYSKYGPLITELHPELVEPVTEYVNECRSLLLGGREHHFLFMNSQSSPFTVSNWTNWIQNIFEAKTGKRIGNNLLRSSFITFAYSNNISEALKRSIAEHMGHRIETAERQYNRAPSIIRRQQGLDFASELMATTVESSSEDSNSPPVGDDDEEGNVAPEHDDEIHYQPAENLQPLFASVYEASASSPPTEEQEPAPFVDSIFFPEEGTSKEEEGPRRSKRARKIPIRLDVVRIVTEGRDQFVAMY